MGRNVASTVENSFIAGRVSEATGLNFPENAVIDEANCVFDERGTVSRRLGIDWEDGYVANNTTRIGGAVTSYEWRAPNGISTLELTVVQIENIIYFYSATDASALSAGKKSFTINLETYKVAGAPATNPFPCQYARGREYLLITHQHVPPLLVAYDHVADTITVTPQELKTRDFTGLVDGLGIDERPSSLSTEHKYNLYNQGWYTDATPASGSKGNVIDIWRITRTSDYPSNCDQWWPNKDAQEKLDISYVDRFATSNSPAPKGHYILNEFSQDRSAASGIAGIPTVSSSVFRPQACAFFSGRAFYAGVAYQKFSNRVYFTPIIERAEQFSQCYQQNDPTDEALFDLLSSDGGVIVIPEAASILRLVSMQGALLVFATNGAWAITGSQGIGFSANDYTIRNISAVQTPSPLSFVDIEGFPIWWTNGGIYAIAGADQLGNFQVQNVTNKTIKTLFNNIPDASKKYAQGSYSPTTKIVQWCYRSTAPTTDKERFEYDTILNYNTTTQAFYTWTVSIATHKLHGIISTPGVGVNPGDQTVTDGSFVPVTDNLGNTVTVAGVAPLSALTVTHYLTSYNSTGSTYPFTFALEKDAGYVDWKTKTGTGTSYTSFCVSGYKIRGDAQRVFQSNYVTVYTETIPGASCYMQGIWDWSDLSSSVGKTSRQQVYPAKAYKVVQHRRLQLRGSGLALQLKFTSEAGKPFRLIGWSSFDTGNASV